MRLSRRQTLTTAAAALLSIRAAWADDKAAGLGDFGPAPDFAGVAAWLNSPPLTMADLRGKVVLIDFWTYSCINCLRTLPYVTRWYDMYKDRGLVVVGVHTPEFAFEHNEANVQTAIKRFGIHYPVALDNSYATWKAYGNQYWPAGYLIDRQGRIVKKHFGEGDYGAMENAIRTLLDAGPRVGADNGQDLTKVGSPEMYFGLARQQMLASPETPQAEDTLYTAPATLPLNKFALIGHWTLTLEAASLVQDGGGIRLHFNSAKVYLVASSPRPITLDITVDGQPQKPVMVERSQLYTLYAGDYRDHMMSIVTENKGLEAFTLTFG